MHINKKGLIEFDNGNMNTPEVIEFLSHLDHCDFCLDQMMEQEDSSTDTAPSYLMEQILDKADSGEVQLARAANKASRKIQLLHYSLQTAAGVMVALLLLFSIPNLDFTSLHQDTSSQTDRILPEHENGRLYQFTRELGQNIGDGTSSFIKYVSDFSSKLMNGGKEKYAKTKTWILAFYLLPDSRCRRNVHGIQKTGNQYYVLILGCLCDRSLYRNGLAGVPDPDHLVLQFL